uniref:Uncharacterized protein n=1 Tax=Rhizophora mucronata TaxID=61149 RepID=A0A2P2P809_RHIMU
MLWSNPHKRFQSTSFYLCLPELISMHLHLSLTFKTNQSLNSVFFPINRITCIINSRQYQMQLLKIV